MSLFVRSITIDSDDPVGLAAWWCQVFGVATHPDDHPGDPEALCDLGEGVPRLLFQHVPEAKTVKNRVHVDLLGGDRRDDEVDRLVGLGARLVGDFRRPDGYGWVMMTDPEGNEFCVEGPSPAG